MSSGVVKLRTPKGPQHRVQTESQGCSRDSSLSRGTQHCGNQLRDALEGEPITSQGREYAWRGSQSHHRGWNMSGGGANHISGDP
eukprot:1187027-Prorocentrum_minimum.AAC.2